jgi:hypothetical protein
MSPSRYSVSVPGIVGVLTAMVALHFVQPARIPRLAEVQMD